MTRAHKYEEIGLWLCGVAGLAVAAAIACGDSDDTDTGDAAAGAGGTSTAGTGGTSSSGSAGSSGGGATGVTATCASDPATADNTAAVVTAANAFIEALTAGQQTAVAYEKNLTNAAQWSNFPTTFVQRNGVRIGDMSADAQAAAVALAEVAAGETGATLLDELRQADEFLVTDGNASSTDYGRGLFYFSIHGTPSTTAAWMLQIAGHHLAYNITYNGECTSATPLFDGAEPMDWTDSNGAHSPLEAQRESMVALLGSVGSLSGAQLSGTFGDLVNGPAGGGPGAGGPGGGGTTTGGGDTKYPSELTYPTGTTGRGAAVANFTSEQKELVKTAIEAWVDNVADPISSALLAEYESDAALAETYVGYSGSADLSTQSSYVRIDGPRVWIEVTVQGGIIYRDVVHFHTIWRDKVADYGAEYTSQ